jgi:adenylate cyclase
MSVKHVEIERKFLVKAMPDLSRVQKTYIQQGYITHSNDSVEVRLRQKDEHSFITVKSGSGTVRNEHEILIDQQQFETLWPETQGKQIENNRWTGQLDSQTYELDVFAGAQPDCEPSGREFESLQATAHTLPCASRHLRIPARCAIHKKPPQCGAYTGG